MFNPYPSLGGRPNPEPRDPAARTASYAAVGAPDPKDSPATVSTTPRTSPTARTASYTPVGAADPDSAAPVPKDSPTAPVPKDSPEPGAREPVATRTPTETKTKTGAVPVLPFNFLRPGTRAGEPPADPKNPDEPTRPGRKKP